MRPNLFLKHALGIVGAFALLAGLQGSAGAAIAGLMMIALAILWYRSIKDIHHVLIMSASTESKAMKDVDEVLIDRIVASINEAIIHRG